MKPYGILSPQLGLKLNVPHILLKDANVKEIVDTFYQRGELWSLKKRLKEFDYQFPDGIIGAYEFFKEGTSEHWFIAFTKEDVAYRDANNDRFVYINQVYTQGTIATAVNDSGGASFTLTFTLPSGESLSSSVKVGDYLKLSDNSAPHHTGETWYEVEEVLSATSLRLTGQLPSGYSVPSGGDTYTVRIIYSGTDTDHWCAIKHVDASQTETMIFTNNGVDWIQVWTGSGQASDLGGAKALLYKSQRLYYYNGRVLLIRPIINGTLYPFDFGWSGLDDATDWGGSGSDAGFLTVDEGPGTLTYAAQIRGFLILIKSEAIVQAWNVSDANVFNKKLSVGGEGTEAWKSIIELNDRVYFWNKKNNFSVTDGLAVRSISDEIEPITHNLNPNYTQYIEGHYVSQYRQILWAVPEATDTQKKTILIYDTDLDNWTKQAVPNGASVFGHYNVETTYDWATLPFANWSDWSWDSWLHREGLANFPIDLVCGYDGYVYRLNGSETDNGASYTRSFTLSTDFGDRKKLHIYKRILFADVYVRQEGSGSMTISVKRDDENAFQGAHSVSLAGSMDILRVKVPISYRGRTFEIKFSATNRFRFLGVVFWYTELGAR